MNGDFTGYVLGLISIVVQVVVIYGLARLLSILTDRILPDSEE